MNRPRRWRAAPVAASIVVLALGFAACGDDDDADTTTIAGSVEDTASTDASVAATAPDATEPDASEPDASAPDGTAGEPAEEQDYVDAAAAALGFDDEDTSQCVAQALIDAIGMERIESSGVTPEEFTAGEPPSALGLGVAEDDAPALQADVEECGDLVDDYLESGGLAGEQAECARAELTDELVAELIAVAFSDLPPSAELNAAFTAVQECTAG